MIVQRFACCGIGPFRTPVELDFSDVPAGSIITPLGTNGAGKTTLLEAMGFGAPFREFPSYRDPKGSKGEALATHVPPDVRDAYLDVTYLLHGRPVRLRVEIDGKRRKTEAYITWDGQTRGPLPTEVDAIVAELFPSRDLMLVGPFACQGGFDGFFRRGPGDRKAIFAEIIRAGHLEVLAAGAAQDETAALEALAAVRDEIAKVRARVDLLQQRRGELAGATEAVRAADVDVGAARMRHGEAENAHRDAREALVRAEANDAERARLTNELEAIDRRIADASTRLAGVQALRDAGAGIRTAAAELARIDGQLTDARTVERVAADRLPALEAAVATATAERDRLVAEYRREAAARDDAAAAQRRVDALAEVEQRRDALTAQLAAERDALNQHDAKQPELAAAVTAAAEALVGHDALGPEREAAAQREHAAISRRRELQTRRDDLVRRNALLADIPGVPECGTCPLTTDLRREVEALSAIDGELVTLPAIEGTPAEDALRAHRATRTTLEQALQVAQRNEREHEVLRRGMDAEHRRTETAIADANATLAAGAGDRTEAAKLADLERQVAELAARGKQARETLDAATAAHVAGQQAARDAQGEVADLEREREQHAATAARLPELAAADAQHAEVSRTLSEAEIARGEVVEGMASVPALTAAGARASIDAATQAVEEAAAAVAQAESRHATALRTHAALEAEVATLGDPDAELATLTARETRHVTDASDCAVLKRALGNKGVQALLIDAVGPEVSAIANELIAENYTARFAIALTTTQPRADGKGVTEVFDARILDAEAGREGTRGSGGETALIDAALRLATTIVNIRRSGVETKTLFLDEPTAALSEENGPKYVAMIRHAMRIGGFHHAFLVSHAPEVWEQADVRLVVEDGAVRMVVAGTVAA